MPLPEKDFHSLVELAQRWHTTLDDIRYYAVHDKLKVKAWIDEEVVKVFRLKKVEDGQLVPVQEGFTTYKDYAFLAPADLRRIFRGDTTPIQEFTARNGDLLKIYNSGNRYVFTVDDLVVSRWERERFEKVYTVPCPCENIPTHQATDPCRAISFGGRPSTMYLVLQHFAERCNGKALLPSLKKESDYLAAWAVNNVKNGQPPRSRTIMNTIRTDYRQQIVTQSNLPTLPPSAEQQKSA